MKILSFIIPAYNSEGFLHKCVDSMLVPEILDKLEILIINDGSTDATEAIGQDYMTRYPGTIRLISQKNRGHGGALNTGCQAAQGKYLKVIDADDWVLSENLPAFLNILESCDSDVVITQFHSIDITTGSVKSWRSYPAAYGTPYTLAQIMSAWRDFDRCLTFHGITYRRDFYRQFASPLLEKCFYEDCEYATFPCCYAKSILPLELFLYEYRVGDVNQSVSVASRLKRISHMEAVLHRMVEKYQLLPSSPGKEYAVMKLRDLLMDYLTVVLLIFPDRRAGYQMAQQEMARMKELAPECYASAIGKYRVFQVLNRLHIRKATWDCFQHSRFYNFLRKNHSFD